MSKKLKMKSLSERVTESLSKDLSDPETDSQDEDTPKVIHLDEKDYDFQQSNISFSSIRKGNVKLLSELSSKYSGVVASRKNDDNTSGDESDSNSNADDGSDVSKDCPMDSNYNESEASKPSIQSYSSTEDEETPASLVSAKNNKLEAEKGICVQNQLCVWEKLLEIRIHSQKMVNKANSLPFPDDFNKLCSYKEFEEPAQDVKKNVEVLIEKLIEAKVTLANQFSEIKNLGISARKSNSRSYENNDNSSKKFAPFIEKNFEKFKPYRNAVLLKWEDRTKLLGPSTGTKRKHLNDEIDITEKIENVLINRDEHIAKSQKVKGNYKLYGQSINEDSDKTADAKDKSSPHIYDDTDFYHSQLRELIEFKSNMSSTAYDVTKQFTELQKLRQKMKKKVDTRASKGRKIRYVVHNKLVNFMAPNGTNQWTDESKNELYMSLFVT